MESAFGDVDPRVMLAILGVTLTVDAAKKIISLVKQNSNDDAELAAVIAEAESRIARRS